MDTNKKPSRFNLVLSFEQYKVLVARKKYARENDERVRYTDLVKEWGIKQHHMASAVFRGIKIYDYMIWKEEQNAKQNRDSVSGLHQNHSQKVKVVYVQPGSN